MHVLRTAERTLALPIGRAMFTFATVSSVTRELYEIPKIELTIRLLPQGITIAPEAGKMPFEALNWADFHNGVAAALRISPSTGAIDSSWISFNRPTELSAEHAGFLFGLGLTGHLKQMLTWHTFGYLTPKHEMTSIGVLLGLSAANVGSANKHVTKLLAVHTPAFLPSPDVDLNVPFTTQTAGLVGIGLLYMGTKNRRMAEVALHQISRVDIAQPDLPNECREAYTLSAALSFGMIMLGRGSGATSPADVALLSRLRVLMHGEGPREGSSKQEFDVNLTSPAASIAMGLMYLKTNRRDIADIMTIPDSVASLNLIQPNFLLVRTIARNLIMWDDIKPTQKWLVDQIPKSIMEMMEKRETSQVVDDAIELAYYHINSGSIFALALKYAGTASQEAYGIISQFFDFFHRLSSSASK
jgi:anaphase-promoting complex subunit 1